MLRKLLRYEPITGLLFWRERGVEWFKDTPKRTAEHTCNQWNSKWAGREAFACVTIEGRLRGGLFGYNYLAHRVIWAMETGEWPKDQIDHEDGDPVNNRFKNLRDVTHNTNQKNMRLRDDNTSSYCGVSMRRDTGKWRAFIAIDGKHTSLGSFKCITAAAVARKIADVKHDYYINHGRRTPINPT